MNFIKRSFYLLSIASFLLSFIDLILFTIYKKYCKDVYPLENYYFVFLLDVNGLEMVYL